MSELLLQERNWKQGALTVGSALGTAGISYALWGQPAISAVILLVAHEYGHYLAAALSGSKAYTPVFGTIGIKNFGVTRIVEIAPEAKKILAIAGPLLGAGAALLSILLLKAFNLTAFIPAIAVLLAHEIGWGIFGPDGRKFRRA